MRPSKSSRSTPSTASSNPSRLTPAGRIATPYSSSASLTVDKNRFGAACPATHSTTRELGMGRMSSETTLVSRMIIRRQLSRIGAVGAGVFAGESQGQPRQGKRIWPESSSPGFPGPAADGRGPFSKYPWPPLPSNDHSQPPEYAAAASALLLDCAQLCLPSQIPFPDVTSL